MGTAPLYWHRTDSGVSIPDATDLFATHVKYVRQKHPSLLFLPHIFPPSSFSSLNSSTYSSSFLYSTLVIESTPKHTGSSTSHFLLSSDTFSLLYAPPLYILLLCQPETTKGKHSWSVFGVFISFCDCYFQWPHGYMHGTVSGETGRGTLHHRGHVQQSSLERLYA